MAMTSDVLTRWLDGPLLLDHGPRRALWPFARRLLVTVVAPVVVVSALGLLYYGFSRTPLLTVLVLLDGITGILAARVWLRVREQHRERRARADLAAQLTRLAEVEAEVERRLAEIRAEVQADLPQAELSEVQSVLLDTSATYRAILNRLVHQGLVQRDENWQPSGNRIEVFMTAHGTYRVRVVSDHEVIVTSEEDYQTKEAAVESATRVQAAGEEVPRIIGVA